MSESNFDAMKREAEELMNMCDCPPEASKILADMTRNEDTLAMFAKVISVFCAHSQTFTAMMVHAITMLTIRIEVSDDDEKETVN